MKQIRFANLDGRIGPGLRRTGLLSRRIDSFIFGEDRSGGGSVPFIFAFFSFLVVRGLLEFGKADRSGVGEDRSGYLTFWLNFDCSHLLFRASD